MDQLGEIINQRNDLMSHTHTGPRASISLLNTKNGPSELANHFAKGSEETEKGHNAIGSVPVSAMTQRASFSGDPSANQNIDSKADGDVQESALAEVLLKAGLPADMPMISLSTKQLIKPLLSSLRQSKITSIIALEPFFSRASLANYEAVYSLGAIDWNAVEKGLEADLFEGE